MRLNTLQAAIMLCLASTTSVWADGASTQAQTAMELATPSPSCRATFDPASVSLNIPCLDVVGPEGEIPASYTVSMQLVEGGEPFQFAARQIVPVIWDQVSNDGCRATFNTADNSLYLPCVVPEDTGEVFDMSLRQAPEGGFAFIMDEVVERAYPQDADESRQTRSACRPPAGYNNVLGQVNGVSVYSNGNTGFYCPSNSSYVDGKYMGVKWQCVEYVRRYYWQKYRINLAGSHTGNANTFYANAARMGLNAYANGGNVAPQVGDILASNGGSYGHVAVVSRITGNQVCVAQQNWSNAKQDADYCLTFTASGNKYSVGAFSKSYGVKGWLRPRNASVQPAPTPVAPQPAPTPAQPVTGENVTYQAHVAYDGWLGWVSSGAVAGTTGQSKSLQAFRIQLSGLPSACAIRYKAHVAYDGWQNWVTANAIAGTTGQSKQVEAIQIELQNCPGKAVQYQVHMANIGWGNWVNNGDVAGTTGQGRAIEAIKIQLISANTVAPTPVTPAPVQPTPSPTPQPVVENRSITITNPSPGEKWKSDKEHTIRWSTNNVSSSKHVSIWFSLDDGANWQLIDSSTSNDGSKGWDFGGDKRICSDTDRARLKITVVEHPEVTTISPQFKIDHKKGYPSC